jgi:hypothetical protein
MLHRPGGSGFPLRVITALIIALVMIVPVMRAPVAAQDGEGFVDDNTYESILDFELTWEDPWVVDPDESGYDPALLGDLLFLDNVEENLYISVRSGPSIGSVLSNLEFQASNMSNFFDDVEVLEIVADKRSGHVAFRYDTDGLETAGYISVTLNESLSTEITTLVFAELRGFDDAIDTIQADIQLDGAPILGDAEGADVLDLLEDGEPIEMPNQGGAPDDDDEDEPTTNEDKKLPEDDEGDEPEATEEPEDDVDETPSDDAELEDLGLIGAREYESPQFGSTVSWSRDWELGEDLLVSDPAGLTDRLGLKHADLEATLFVSFFDGSEISIDDWVTAFEDNVAQNDLPVEVFDQAIEDDAAVIFYSYEIDDELQYGLIEVYFDASEDVLVVVEILGAERDVAEAFDAAQEDVNVDGEAPFVGSREFPEIR